MRRFFKSWISAAAVATVVVLGSWAIRGSTGAMGAGIGLAGIGFNFWALWMGVRAFGNTFARHPGAKPKGAGWILGLAFLLKLPIVVGLGLYTQSLGSGAMDCFLIALAVVYFWAIGWAVTVESDASAATQ